MLTKLCFSSILAALATLTSLNAKACTILVLTDGSRALFCNNEDWLNPKARIWFVPAGEGHLGCAYVGFDNSVTQGGLNTEGLAFDWVAGARKEWKPDANRQAARGLPFTRMLETCTTVDEAIDFFQRYQEPTFSVSEILVADKSGASAIIGYQNGELHVERATQCRGFGYGGQTLVKMLATQPKPTVTNGVAILQACLQGGRNGTKYSSIYDLMTGDIVLFQFPEEAKGVKINLATELRKGAHYYDIRGIRQQLAQAPKPLLDNMQRFFLEQFEPIPDEEPAVTTRLQAILQEALLGDMRVEDYTAECWQEIQGQGFLPAAEELKFLGKITSWALVDRKVATDKRRHRYLVELKDQVEVMAVVGFDLDPKGKVAGIHLEAFQWK